MIVSRTHNFIFLRTSKVASTSIEYALSLHCRGKDDIVTPIEAKLEHQRYQLGILPRNFCHDPQVEQDYIRIIASGDKKRLEHAIVAMQGWKLRNHLPARVVREAVGEEFWNSAFKFSVLRHPYDFVVSLMYYNMSVRGVAPSAVRRFRELATILCRVPRNIDIVSIDGQVAVDRILRYEALTEDLRAIAPIIGFDISGSLTREKADLRPPSATVAAELGPFSRWVIRRRWREEFELCSLASGRGAWESAE